MTVRYGAFESVSPFWKSGGSGGSGRELFRVMVATTSSPPSIAGPSTSLPSAYIRSPSIEIVDFGFTGQPRARTS